MTLPANVRVNMSVPFPSLVTGSGPITIAKNQGIWTVGFSTASLASTIPPVGNYPTDYLLVYDSIAKTFFNLSITNLLTVLGVNAGLATLNFGAFPGVSDVQLVVTGQTAITATAAVDVFIVPAATADHSIDEHWVDPPVVSAGNVVAGVGFTIYGKFNSVTGPDGVNGGLGIGRSTATGGNARCYGAWNVGWRWQ